MTFLLGIALGTAATLALLAYLDRPVKRPTPKLVGAQWTVEAAESLVRGWIR